MNANQIFNFINEVQAEALGSRAMTVKNTSDLVSLGELVLSSTADTDNFYKVLVDRVGKCYIKMRQYFRDDADTLMRDTLDFGIILQKVQTYKIAGAKENGSWTNQVNPFAKEKDTTDIMQSLYSKLGTWEVDTKIVYDYQLQSAFTDVVKMGAFIDLIFTDMRNALEYQIEQCEKLTRATAIIQSFKSPNKNISRNLLAEYNEKFNDVVTTAEALSDASFLKYASMEIGKVAKRFKKMTSVFNGVGADRFTPPEDMVVECLADYSASTSAYLESGVYHKELVSLPLYTEIDCWQASGENYAFEDTSAIKIEDESGVSLNASGIICVIRDKDACGVMIDRVRTKSIYNPASECTSYFHKCDFGTFVDASENCCVFYIADETDALPEINVIIPDASVEVGSKTVGTLQDGILLNGNVLSGTVEYNTGYSDMFPNTPNGNFLALKFTSDANATLEAKVTDATVTTDYQTLTEDGIILIRVKNINQEVIVKATKDGKVATKVVRLARLTLEES